MTTTHLQGKATRASPRPSSRVQPIDFARVNAVAMAALPHLLGEWLPDGRLVGAEWIARNPKRHDKRAGSFRVNIRTGRWCDFAVEDVRGGDPVSLCAYLHGLGQGDAARRLAARLGLT